MMNPIGIRNEDQIGTRDPWFADRTTATSVLEHGERFRAVRGFGGRDGRHGGALLEGAAAVERGPAPAGRCHPPRPGPHRTPPTPPPAAHPTQAPHHGPVAPTGLRERAGPGRLRGAGPAGRAVLRRRRPCRALSPRLTLPVEGPSRWRDALRQSETPSASALSRGGGPSPQRGRAEPPGGES
jgi:hypothetical protein